MGINSCPVFSFYSHWCILGKGKLSFVDKCALVVEFLLSRINPSSFLGVITSVTPIKKVLINS